MTRKLTFLILALLALISGPGAEAWGQTTASVELCTSWNQTLAYATAYTHDYTIDNLNGSTTTMTLGVLGVYRQSNANTYFQMNKKDGYFKNTTKLPGKITKIETTWSAAKGPTKCYFATNEEATSEDATVTVTAATSVTYTPPTDADYYFFNIDVETGSGSAQMTSCKVYYEAKPAHTLTLSATNGSIAAMNGETVIESGDNVEEGAELDITATANDWYKFSGWNVSGTGSTLGSTTANPTTFTMGTADATLTATFASCVVTVNSNNEDWGIALYDDESHTISTLAEDDYRISTTAPYTINPANAATLTAGEDGEYIVSGVKDQDVEITINFEALPTATYTVTFYAGTNGTCSTPELIEEEAGAGVTLPDCTPNTGYQFVGWATTSDATEADAGVAGATYYPTTNTTLYAVYNSVYTITWIVNGTPLTEGEQTTSVVEGEGITTLPTAPSDISEMTFQGWTETQIGTPSATAPTDLFTDAEHAPAITKNTTFYAVFAEESEGDVTWNLANDIAANDVIIIATNKNYNSTMKTAGTISSNLMSCTASTFNSDKTQITSVADGTLEFTLGGNSTSGWTLQNGTNYLGMSGDKKVALSSTSSTWSISISSGVATVSQTYSSKSYSLQYNYNNGNDRFTGYTSGQTAISLYKKTQDITYTYYTNVVVKTLTSITLSGEYPTEFWKGEAFSHEGMTVTAHYSNADDEDVTSKAEFSTPNMSTVGVKTVTVSYETASTTYGITVKTIANTQETAYTVAEAKAIIDANPEELTTIEVYVKGTVSKVDGINDGAITYWLDNNTFEVYKGKNVGGEAFTNVNQISVNDDVTIRGKIKKYYSTYEFDAGNYLISHAKASTLSIGDITVEINGDITPVIETNVVGDYTISYTSDNEEVVLADGDEMVTMGLGEATITATLTAEGYKDAETTFTVEVIKALTSIEIATPPTTTSYKVGDFFNPAGLVITANYNDESTEDVTYAENEDKFTFTPSLETPLTIENTSVTITYAGKSTTQTISVRALNTYNITWMANGEAVSLTPATVIEGNEIGTLPTPDAANIPNGYTFMGWSANEVTLTSTAPDYVTVETVPTSDMTLYAVFAIAEVSGATALNKMGAGDVLNNGDNIVIVATGDDWAKALYQETVSSSYVNFYDFTGNVNDVITDSKNYVTLNIATEGKWKLGDATNGYVYNASSNDLTVDTENSTEWTISWVNDKNKYSIKNGNRWLSCRSDLTTGGNQYKFRGGGTTTTNGTVYFDLYKLTTSTTTYSNFCTTVNALSGTITQSDITPNTAYYISGVTTINNANAVEIAALTNDNPANLIIKDGGQLIHHNAGVAATFQKNITGYTSTSTNDNYYLIAAPIADASIEGLTTNEYDLFSYDEPTHYWFNQKGTANPFNTLSLGQGYLYANSTTGNVTISGIISNEQDPTIAVTASASNLTGFNLVGNPFSYNLSISDMAMMDDDTEIYGITSIYQISGTAVVASQNTSVAPCEGFFIQAPVAGELYFNAGSSRSAKSPVSDLKVEVKEATRSAQLIDRAYVNFSESRPMNKFYLNENSTRLYIPQNGEDFAVVMASAAEGELPVNFKAEKNGTYTISVNTENVEANYLHLIDNLTGMDTDLLSTPSYTFDAKTSDYASRFKLVFGVKNDNEEMSQASSFAYINNGEIVISNEGRATLQVIDVLGRIVSSEEINGECRISTNGLTAGLYILNLNGMTQKIVVR